MTYEYTLNNVPLVFEYDIQEHAAGKFPKIKSILLNTKLDDYKENTWDLREIIDHTLVEQIKSRIFKELNKDISNK
tara:strand:- start:69 stop:296 length:228 start_codon:yes stop_codon:yes gene_type:complete